jgi:hypothetical protein
MPEKLVLLAKDAEDLQVIGACLQDGLVRVGDIRYFAEQRRFALLVNRFKWEEEATGEHAVSSGSDRRFATIETHQRVHCGVAFDRVRAIRMRGIDRQERNRLLNLLTIQGDPDGVTIVFSGEATIRLDVEAIACRIEDLDEPWPTAWRPEHESKDIA